MSLEIAAAAAALVAASALAAALRRSFPGAGAAWSGRYLWDGALFSWAAAAMLGIVNAMTAAGDGPSLSVALAAFLLAFGTLRFFTTSSGESGEAPRRPLILSVLGAGAFSALWYAGIVPSVWTALDDVQWSYGAGTVTVQQLLRGGLAVTLAFGIALGAASAVESWLLADVAPEQKSSRKLAASVLRIMLAFSAVSLGLAAVGVDITALSIVGAAAGVGVGFGLRHLASNYTSSYVILTEGTVRVGDVVKIGAVEGRVTQIASRYTVVGAGGGREVIVPNDMVVNSRVENLTLQDRLTMLTTVVRVRSSVSPAELRDPVEQAVTGVPRVLADPAPQLHLNDLAQGQLELSLVYWIADPENGQASVKSEVNLALLEVLRQLPVELGPRPYSIDLHGCGTAQLSDLRD